MIKIDLVNTWFLAQDLSEKAKNSLEKFAKKIEEKKYGFVDLDEKNSLNEISEFVKKQKENFDSVVVLWIWWSALGSRAILTALKGKYYNELSKKKRKNCPKIYILDNVDPSEIKNLLDVISLKKTLFIVISKSGSTIETLSQYNFFKEKVEKKDLKLQKHFVFVAWENTEFALNKEKEGFKVFTLAENVGWRFSVLSNVWLLPLAFAWIDIEKLLEGQRDLKKIFFENNLITNLALHSALLQYNAYENLKKNITIFFPYSSNLKEFWAWYKQLFNESLGKNGIWATLTTSVWTTDQHSDLQLYVEWPKDKFIIFLELGKFEKNYKIQKDKKMKFSDLMHIEKYGTAKSLTEREIPNYTIKIDEISEKTLWELIFFFEIQVAFLWEFFEIDAFNQPWVEFGKIIAKDRIKELFGE